MRLPGGKESPRRFFECRVFSQSRLLGKSSIYDCVHIVDSFILMHNMFYLVKFATKPFGERRANEQSMREFAYAHIQRMIASGALPAGAPVSELHLSKKLRISRTPIREAIGQLVGEGLLDQVPNRGAVVVQLRRQDIIELYELREALEVYAVGKAARQPVGRSDVDRLKELANSMLVFREELKNSGELSLNPEQMHRLTACDLAFHTLLMRTAANPRIVKIVNETRLLIRIFAMHRDGHTAARLDRMHRHHRDVLRGVIERDPDLAMRTLSEHIQASLQERLEEFDHWEREASLRESMPPFLDLAGGSDS